MGFKRNLNLNMNTQLTFLWPPRNCWPGYTDSTEQLKNLRRLYAVAIHFHFNLWNGPQQCHRYALFLKCISMKPSRNAIYHWLYVSCNTCKCIKCLSSLSCVSVGVRAAFCEQISLFLDVVRWHMLVWHGGQGPFICFVDAVSFGCTRQQYESNLRVLQKTLRLSIIFRQNSV